ncbi:MAG: TolC family protein [Bacteroidales bacterium]
MRRLIFFTGLLLTIVFAVAQNTITLQECYEKAMEHHPAGLQKAELETINNLNKDIIATSWLPQSVFNAQATYQSDVIDIGQELPGFDFPSPTRDQYRMSLELQQMIYDGGTAKHRQKLREAQHLAELNEIEVQLYQVLEQVNRHFFRYFILEENLKVLDLTREEINQRIHSVRSAVENGALLPSAQWTLEAELLRLEQKRNELLTTADANLEILGILTGEDLADKKPALPVKIFNAEGPLNRPELKLFELQKESLFAASGLTSTARMPRISTFAQAGYGRPGLNMLSEDFDFFYLAGIRLSWNIWDWDKTNNEKQIQQVKAEIIHAQEKVFEQKISIALTSVTSLILQIEKNIEKDMQIIALREKILESAGSQLQNGVITSTEYLQQVNSLAQAKIEARSNQVRLIQARAEYNIITGNHD